MNVVAIIQARMGSTRLPGKVMMELVGKTVLEHVITRVQQSKLIDEIVIATTTKLDDNAIVEEAKRLGVKCFRGSEDDVLGRYYYAAKENKADIVVRITSDCPLIDHQVLDEMIFEFKSLHMDKKVDYLSNTLERTFPRGLDVEVFSFKVLEESFNNANETYEREHVTPYIYENPEKFRLKGYMNNKDYSYHRWTLDTPEDLKLITKIYEDINSKDKLILFNDVTNYLNVHPEVLQINNAINQKELKG